MRSHQLSRPPLALGTDVCRVTTTVSDCSGPRSVRTASQEMAKDGAAAATPYTADAPPASSVTEPLPAAKSAAADDAAAEATPAGSAAAVSAVSASNASTAAADGKPAAADAVAGAGATTVGTTPAASTSSSVVPPPPPSSSSPDAKVDRETRVLVFSISACKHCRAAKALLQSKGVPFHDVNLDVFPQRREECHRLSGRRTVPQIFIGAHHVGGNDELQAANRAGSLDHALKGEPGAVEPLAKGTDEGTDTFSKVDSKGFAATPMLTLDVDDDKCVDPDGCAIEMDETGEDAASAGAGGTKGVPLTSEEWLAEHPDYVAPAGVDVSAGAGAAGGPPVDAEMAAYAALTERLSALVDAMGHPVKGVPRRSKRMTMMALRPEHNCVTGADVFSWIARNKAATREEARASCEELLRYEYLHPVGATTKLSAAGAARDTRSSSDGGIASLSSRQAAAAAAAFEPTDKAVYRFQRDEKREALNTAEVYSGPVRAAATVAASLRAQILNLYNTYLSDDGNAVDYARLGSSVEFAEYVRAASELQVVDLGAMDRDTALAFWINVYNALVIHATVVLGTPSNAWGRSKFFSNAAYKIGTDVRTGASVGIFALNDIEHGILRGNRKPPGALRKRFAATTDPRRQYVMADLDPRIHFALVCGAKSCPPIKLYQPADVQETLTMATQAFLEDDANCKVERSRCTVHLSKILGWYMSDFAEASWYAARTGGKAGGVAPSAEADAAGDGGVGAGAGGSRRRTRGASTSSAAHAPEPKQLAMLRWIAHYTEGAKRAALDKMVGEEARLTSAAASEAEAMARAASELAGADRGGAAAAEGCAAITVRFFEYDWGANAGTVSSERRWSKPELASPSQAGTRTRGGSAGAAAKL